MRRIYLLILSAVLSLLLCTNVGAASLDSSITVIPAKYDNLKEFTSSDYDINDNKLPLLKFQEGEKYGVINKDGDIIADAIYDDILDYFHGFIIVIKDDKVGFIDENGKKITDIKYDMYGVGNFFEGLARVEFNGKWGFIDATGKEVIPLKYDNVFNFVDGVAPVCVKGKWGLIDKTGKEILAPKYAQIGYEAEGIGTLVSFRGGIAQVKDFNNKWGYIDETGKEVVKPQFDEAYDYRDGFAPFVKNKKVGLVTKEGIVLNPIYDYIYDFGENDITFFSQGKKLGLINKNMIVIAKPQFDAAGTISADGYMKVKKGNKYGFIDKNGKEIIKPQYDGAGTFCYGLAPVVIKGKIGYINIKNKLVIPAQFEIMKGENGNENFEFGTAVVLKGGKYGIIDKNGKYLTKLKYDSIEHSYENQLYIVKEKGKFGIIDKKGKVILNPNFTRNEVVKNVICAEYNGLSKLFGLDGKVITQQSYKNLTPCYADSREFEIFTFDSNGKKGALIYRLDLYSKK